MAKEIKISLSDAQFGVLQDAYAKDDDAVEKADVDEAYVKGRLMNSLKAKVRHYDEAKYYAHQAIELRPATCQAAHLLGAIAQDLLQNEEAVDWYQRALAADPTYYLSKMNLASLKSLLGDNSSALEIIEEIMASRPGNPDVVHNYGTLLSRAGNFKKATEVFKRNILWNNRL